MERDYYKTIVILVEYEKWCNLEAVDFLSSLSNEQCRTNFGFGLGTPHRTVSHIADVMEAWSGCVAPTIRQPSWREYDATETLQDIRTRMCDVAEFWLAAAKASHLGGLLSEDGRLNHLFHLVTHGTHHRGQLLGMVTLMGFEQPFEGGDFGGWSISGPGSST